VRRLTWRIQGEMDKKRYEELAAKEGAHWGAVAADPSNPQNWEDEGLFEIFSGGEYRHLIERVRENGPRVLELGCGRGELALTLAERGLSVTGVDLSSERISFAK